MNDFLINIDTRQCLPDAPGCLPGHFHGLAGAMEPPTHEVSPGWKPGAFPAGRGILPNIVGVEP